MSTKRTLGDPGENLAKAHLHLIMNGTIHTGTANDDDNKVDARIVYSCPFSAVMRELRCQIKTGDSYGDWTHTKQRFRINLKPEFRETLRNNPDPTLLIWIPEERPRVLYALIPPHRTRRGAIYLSEHSELSPATLFDVARQHHIFTRTQQSRRINFGCSLTLAESIRKLKEKDWRKLSFSKAKVVKNLRLSANSVRHVSRNSRASVRRRLSMDALTHLPRILETAPRTCQILTRRSGENGKRRFVESMLLLKYPAVLKSNSGKLYSVRVRIREVISFPAAWTHALLCIGGPSSGTVECRASFDSWYLKEDVNG